ncbi:MAG: sigma-70 family RNA polymerase sigma factor [Bacilli bacterium]|nr:sigma-70 family RNA polymerase sigma factor [Bacilli bacterium]
MDYKNINDYEVLYMIKEKNDYAQGIMYNKYLPIIKNIAAKNSNFAKQRGAEYEDLVQEGYIGLSNAINSYKDNLNTLFYTYACLCIERQIGVFCRKLSSKRNEVLNNCCFDENIFINQHNILDSSNPEVSSIDNENYNSIIKIKNRFNLINSCIFELRYNGFTYKEISNLLDLSMSSVDGRLSKIRRTLHRIGKNII